MTLSTFREETVGEKMKYRCLREKGKREIGNSNV